MNRRNFLTCLFGALAAPLAMVKPPWQPRLFPDTKSGWVVVVGNRDAGKTLGMMTASRLREQIRQRIKAGHELNLEQYELFASVDDSLTQRIERAAK